MLPRVKSLEAMARRWSKLVQAMMKAAVVQNFGKISVRGSIVGPRRDLDEGSPSLPTGR